jgi:hypothetical protein
VLPPAPELLEALPELAVPAPAPVEVPIGSTTTFPPHAEASSAKARASKRRDTRSC